MNLQIFVSSISGPIEVGGGRTYFCTQIKITNQWLKDQDILFLPSPASAVYFLIPGDYKEIARDEVISTCGLTGPGIAILSGLPYLNKDGAYGQEKGVYMEKIMSDPDLKLDITHP